MNFALNENQYNRVILKAPRLMHSDSQSPHGRWRPRLALAGLTVLGCLFGTWVQGDDTSLWQRLDVAIFRSLNGTLAGPGLGQRCGATVSASITGVPGRLLATAAEMSIPTFEPLADDALLLRFGEVVDSTHNARALEAAGLPRAG